jgi:hypothetical protein
MGLRQRLRQRVRVLVDYGTGWAKVWAPGRKDQQTIAAAMAVPSADSEKPTTIVLGADAPIQLRGTRLEAVDQLDRQRWSIAVAETFRAFPVEFTHAMADEGFDKFLAVTRPHWEVHGFHLDDYRRAYDHLVARSQRLKARGQFTGGGERWLFG